MLGLGLTLSGIYFYRSGFSAASLSILIASFVFLIPLALNRVGYVKSSRIFLCLLLPMEVLIISVLTKINAVTPIETSNFFDGRLFILGSALLPLLVIEMKEWRLLLFGMSGSFLSLASFDMVHEAFGVGHYDLGLTGANYYFAAYFYSFLTFLFMIGSMGFQKLRTEKFEQDNTKLIEELNATNILLRSQKEEIELQNHEIMAQSEELQTNQDQLVEAMNIIEKQKEKLEGKNLDLESELILKNEELNETNDELVKHNNELRQFSYTISHNLRGPIARLLGLTQLINRQRDAIQIDEIFKMSELVNLSAFELDGLLRDLSKIIDIRNDIYRIRERVDLKEIVELIRQELKDQWKHVSTYSESLDENSDLYAIRPMVHSILYNLLSNAIKYRQIDKPLSLTVNSRKEGNYSVIEVSDNGLGINLELFKNDLFKMYKRFHMHTEGKGLGLYLVKVQTEAMGGRIEVISTPNRGSQFQVWIKNPMRVDDQIIFDHPKAQIYYNAPLDVTGLVHKTVLTGEEYRTIYLKCLEILKSYNSKAWVFDLLAQTTAIHEDLSWLFDSILPEAKAYGLKRLALVLPEQHHIQSNQTISLSRRLGVHISIHGTLENAIQSLKEEMDSE
jgi:signal transduction histidine kinase